MIAEKISVRAYLPLFKQVVSLHAISLQVGACLAGGPLD